MQFKQKSSERGEVTRRDLLLRLFADVDIQFRKTLDEQVRTSVSIFQL